MSTELRESFPILEDAVNGNAGAALSLKTEGDQAGSGGTNYAGVLPLKKPDGSLQFLKGTATGELVISTQTDDLACLDAEGTIEDGAGTLTLICEITLQNSKVYKEIEYLVSCLRTTKYQLDWIDDEGGVGTVTVLAQGRCGAGQYDAPMHFKCKEFTSGGTGVQKLRLQAYNTGSQSDIDGALTTTEVQ